MKNSFAQYPEIQYNIYIETKEEKQMEDEVKLYICSDCGELSECHWECPTCESDDLMEYEPE